MAVLDPQHVHELEARISELEQAIQAAAEQVGALAAELRKYSGSENGTPRPKSVPVSTPLSTANRVLGEPEFAKVPAHAWISGIPDKILIAIFLLVLFLPPAAYLLHWESGESLRENRNLAKAPAFGTDPVEKLPAIIDAYYRDYFGFRKRLIRWHDTIRYKWLGVSTDQVVIGKDGWAFFVGEGNLRSFMGVEPLSPAQLATWKRYIEQRQQVLEAQGIRYLFVVAPNKETIYPEMLPSYIRAKAARTQLDQLLAYLAASKSPVEVLDLRAALRAGKAQGLVYYPQDTHWNGRGYFIAYQEICRRLQKWFPDIRPQTVGADYDIRTISWPGGDSWGMLGLPGENTRFPSDFLYPKGTQSAQTVPIQLPPLFPPLPDVQRAPVKSVQPKANHGLIVFHDSFMRAGVSELNHFPFAENFARCVHVGHKPTLDQLLALAGQERPDVIVEEWVERYLRTTPDVTEAAPPPVVPACAAPAERLIGPAFAAAFAGSGLKLRAATKGLELEALEGVPHVIMLPKRARPIGFLSVKLTAPKAGFMELYEISPNPNWGRMQQRVLVAPGANQFVLQIKAKDLIQLRLDPVNYAGRFTITELNYYPPCN